MDFSGFFEDSAFNKANATPSYDLVPEDYFNVGALPFDPSNPGDLAMQEHVAKSEQHVLHPDHELNPTSFLLPELAGVSLSSGTPSSSHQYPHEIGDLPPSLGGSSIGKPCPGSSGLTPLTDVSVTPRGPQHLSTSQKHHHSASHRLKNPEMLDPTDIQLSSSSTTAKQYKFRASRGVPGMTSSQQKVGGLSTRTPIVSGAGHAAGFTAAELASLSSLPELDSMRMRSAAASGAGMGAGKDRNSAYMRAMSSSSSHSSSTTQNNSMTSRKPCRGDSRSCSQEARDSNELVLDYGPAVPLMRGGGATVHMRDAPQMNGGGPDDYSMQRRDFGSFGADYPSKRRRKRDANETVVSAEFDTPMNDPTIVSNGDSLSSSSSNGAPSPASVMSDIDFAMASATASLASLRSASSSLSPTSASARNSRQSLSPTNMAGFSTSQLPTMGSPVPQHAELLGTKAGAKRNAKRPSRSRTPVVPAASVRSESPLSQLSESPTDLPSPSNGRDAVKILADRRKKHNEVESRRRQKISRNFVALKEISKSDKADRGSILQAAITRLQTFEDVQIKQEAEILRLKHELAIRDQQQAACEQAAKVLTHQTTQQQQAQAEANRQRHLDALATKQEPKTPKSNSTTENDCAESKACSGGPDSPISGSDASPCGGDSNDSMTKEESEKCRATSKLLQEAAEHLAKANGDKMPRAGSLAPGLYGPANQSNAAYQSHFVGSGVTMALVRPDGQFLDCNIAFEEMSGYSREELLKTNMFALTMPEDLPNMFSCVRSLISGGTVCKMVKRWVTKAGKTFSCCCMISVVRDPDTQQPKYFMCLGPPQGKAFAAQCEAMREKLMKDHLTPSDTAPDTLG